MKAAAVEAYWRSYPAKAEESFGIVEKIGSLDVESRRAKHICLNTAEHLEETGFKLTLAVLDDKARLVFRVIPELAFASIEGNEKGYYNSVHFARYMAMRLAATAEWMLSGSRCRDYMTRMLDYLEDNVHVEAAKAKGEVRGVPDVGGRLAMHYAQAGRWTEIVELPALMRGGGAGAPLWRSLFKPLRLLAAAKSRPDDERANRKAREVLDAWFLEHTSVGRFGQPWHPGLTSNDIVSIAGIRARWLYGITDPWKTVRSIRWPILQRES